MTYTKKIMVDSLSGNEYELITRFGDGCATIFANEESNMGHARQAYLAWVSEGNEPEIINNEV